MPSHVTGDSLHAAANQTERAAAIRVYLERAAATSWCVGAHYFNLYDRNALYCPTGNENWSIGLLDITHKRHEEVCNAVRASNERLYTVATGEQLPFDRPVKYRFGNVVYHRGGNGHYRSREVPL